MSCRYSSPATEPAPNDPSSIALRRASRRPFFTRAVTRYLIACLGGSTFGRHRSSVGPAPLTFEILVIRRMALVVSGRQPLTSPRAIRLLHISQTIVQAARPPLPELEFVGHNPIAAPPLGTRYRTIAIAALDALERFFEHVTALDRLALLRGVDAQAAIERARLEIRIRFHGTDALDDTIDAHLPLDGRPEEQQARAACGLHLARLPALIVRVEDVAAIVDPLEQHRSHGGPAVRRRGRQRHRRRIGLGVTDLFEPVRELTHRIGIRVHLAERFAEVLAPDIC